MSTTTATAPAVTEKQIAFLDSLAGDLRELASNRLIADDDKQARMNLMDVVLDNVKQGSRKEASNAIDFMISLRSAWAQELRRAEQDVRLNGVRDLLASADDGESTSLEGMHRKDGIIYKVQRSQDGREYAKKLVMRGECEGHETLLGHIGQTDYCDGTCRPKAEQTATFEYAPGAVRQLSEKTRMTLEEAKSFGALYGTCCVCGATLSDEKSIAAGIGPVCAKKF